MDKLSKLLNEHTDDLEQHLHAIRERINILEEFTPIHLHSNHPYYALFVKLHTKWLAYLLQFERILNQFEQLGDADDGDDPDEVVLPEKSGDLVDLATERKRRQTS